MTVEALKVENNPDVVAVSEDEFETYRLIDLDMFEEYIEDFEEQATRKIPLTEEKKTELRNSTRYREKLDADGNATGEIEIDTDYNPEAVIAVSDEVRVKDKTVIQNLATVRRDDLNNWRNL